jgi:hypothetical protein
VGRAVRRAARWLSGFLPLWVEAILLAYRTLREEVKP